MFAEHIEKSIVIIILTTKLDFFRTMFLIVENDYLFIYPNIFKNIMKRDIDKEYYNWQEKLFYLLAFELNLLRASNHVL